MWLRDWATLGLIPGTVCGDSRGDSLCNQLPHQQPPVCCLLKVGRSQPSPSRHSGTLCVLVAHSFPSLRSDALSGSLWPSVGVWEVPSWTWRCFCVNVAFVSFGKQLRTGISGSCQCLTSKKLYFPACAGFWVQRPLPLTHKRKKKLQILFPKRLYNFVFLPKVYGHSSGYMLLLQFFFKSILFFGRIILFATLSKKYLNGSVWAPLWVLSCVPLIHLCDLLPTPYCCHCSFMVSFKIR